MFSILQALAQDQLRSLLVMTEGLGIDIGVYDGDTSHERRCWLRDNARLVLYLYDLCFLQFWWFCIYNSSAVSFSNHDLQLITNPDMLHLTILPNHKQFERILSNIRY